MTITKAIIPVAGWGTRRLPITKSVEKCMLPIGNVPVIDFIVQDCLQAGITDFYFVVSGAAQQLKSYYAHHTELNDYLTKNGKEDLLPLVTPPAVNFHFITQDTANGQYGTTVPVWLCREHIAQDEQVLVIMGDQFFYRTDGGSNAADLMHQVTASGLRSGLFGVPVPDEKIHQYGIIEKNEVGNYVRIVEKPQLADAPSNLNNASFYLFDALFFEFLDRDMQIEREGEYMITDSINQYVADGNAIKVCEAQGEYLDAGTVDGWLHANRVVLNDV
jgi:UTP--glucose-1-phosphate uridylyltransferase